MQLVRLVNRAAEKDVAEKEGWGGEGKKSSIQTGLNAREENVVFVAIPGNRFKNEIELVSSDTNKQRYKYSRSFDSVSASG